jgi:hypothetical protein
MQSYGWISNKVMYRLNQDGKFFDFTFTVQDEQFHVSKLMLSTISPYFANKFEAEWKVSLSPQRQLNAAQGQI